MARRLWCQAFSAVTASSPSAVLGSDRVFVVSSECRVFVVGSERCVVVVVSERRVVVVGSEHRVSLSLSL
jgi:hypothetical protein